MFEFLNATKTYTGPVLFLEEDYYVTPDIHHMLKLVYDGKKRFVIPDTLSISLPIHHLL